VATSAYWTDKETVPGVTVHSGALHIDLPGSNRVRNETYAWTGFDLSGIAANGSRAATLVVSNHSDPRLSFSYDVKAEAADVGSGNLAAALRIRVWRGGGVTAPPNPTCTGGTQIAGPGASTFPFNQPAGANIAPGGSQTLCVEVSRTGAAVTAGSQATLTFTFPAKQVP